jgi:DNA-binding GntR family transcriptional regulator
VSVLPAGGGEDTRPREMATPTLHINQPRLGDEQSLSDRAYYAIREWIVTLDLAPGSVLSERDLMERLGVGRTPVREALRDLAREQLVEVFPRRGIFVSGVEVGDIAGLSEVRRVLESQAARLAAERRNRDDLAATEALLVELAGGLETHGGGAARDRAAGASRDVPRRRRGSSGGIPSGRIPLADTSAERGLIDLDQRIHRHVYRCTHNPFLETTLEEYYVLTLRIWFLALDRVERLDDAVREHHEILEAIRDGDADRAESVMRRHIVGFEQAMRAVL